MKTRVTKLCIRIGASLASSTVFLLALEVTFRLWSGVPLELRDWRVLHMVSTAKSEYDARLGWVLKAHFHGENINTLEHGIRRNGAQYSELRSGGVLAVGGSFTLGSEVADSESWPAQLEQILGRPVVNAGVSGYGSDQILMRAEQLLPVVHPELVLVAFVAGDIPRAGYSSHGRPKPYYQVEDGALVLRNSPISVASAGTASAPYGASARSLLAYSYIADRVLSAWPDYWFGSKEERYVRTGQDAVEITCRLLDSFRARLAELQVPSLLLLQYGGSDIRQLEAPASHVRLVNDCARKLGMPVVDGFESLRAVYLADPTDLEKYYVMNAGVYGHMSAHGNAHIARLIADALREPSGVVQPPGPACDGRSAGESERWTESDPELGDPSSAAARLQRGAVARSPLAR